MEEDINILTAFLLSNIPEIITQEEFDEVKQAIKNLIKGYRELEKNYINPSKARISYYDTKKGTEVVIEGFIPKSKLQEKKEELETKKKKYGFASLESNILLNEIRLLNELMEDK